MSIHVFLTTDAMSPTLSKVLPSWHHQNDGVYLKLWGKIYFYILKLLLRGILFQQNNIISNTREKYCVVRGKNSPSYQLGIKHLKIPHPICVSPKFLTEDQKASSYSQVPVNGFQSPYPIVRIIIQILLLIKVRISNGRYLIENRKC